MRDKHIPSLEHLGGRQEKRTETMLLHHEKGVLEQQMDPVDQRVKELISRGMKGRPDEEPCTTRTWRYETLQSLPISHHPSVQLPKRPIMQPKVDATNISSKLKLALGLCKWEDLSSDSEGEDSEEERSEV
jgi:hypothetical protein